MIIFLWLRLCVSHPKISCVSRPNVREKEGRELYTLVCNIEKKFTTSPEIYIFSVNFMIMWGGEYPHHPPFKYARAEN